MNAIALVVMVVVVVLFVVSFIFGGRNKQPEQRFNGHWVSPDYKRRTMRQCRSEYVANRQLAGR